MTKTLITSALLYANGKLHFGHVAGCYLPADCFARFSRLQGNETLFISGSDEYGVAITMSAELEGRTPKEQIDHYHSINVDLFKKLGISFDHYSRTSWEGHVAPVQQFFKELSENGFIEERVTDQLYSESDDKFLADRYVVGTCPKCGYEKARGDECPSCGASYETTSLLNPRSKLTDAPLSLKPTKHWFLLLDKFKERLSEWLETKSWKPNVVNFIKGYINDLHPRAITRDTKWGIPVPLEGAEGKVLYVWFDAPIGYISAIKELGEITGDENLWKKWWLDEETKLIHFLGKDNIPFHTAIFPAMCMGQNLPIKLVDEVPANEFYNLEGKKLSKSEGWYVDLEGFLTKFSADQLRYAIASNAPETSDSEFTWKDFQLKCNSDLLGKYGNLVNRILVFTQKACEGRAPPAVEGPNEFLDSVYALADKIADAFSKYKLRLASALIMELAALGNVYFDQQKPWKQAKEDPAAMLQTIRNCLECLKVLAVVSFPVIPTASEKVWKLIGMEGKIVTGNWNSLIRTPLSENALPKPEILFKRVEDDEVELELSKLK